MLLNLIWILTFEHDYTWLIGLNFGIEHKPFLLKHIKTIFNY